MAVNQADRHELGRKGEKIAVKMLGGKTTNHTAPFDIVDFRSKVAYEVKTMAALSQDLKIHISDDSMAKKRAFARQYGLDMVLIAVVIYSSTSVKVFSGELTQSARVSQLKQMEGLR